MRTFAKAATLQVLPSLPLKFEGGRARTGNQSRAFELLGPNKRPPSYRT